MGEISKTLALEETFDYEGKSYKLAPMTYEVMGLWEMHLKRRADLDLLLSKKWLPADEYLEQAAAHRADKAAGKYDFFSPISQAAAESWEGRIELSAIRVAEAKANGLDPAAARKLVREVLEHSAEKWKELQDRLEGMDADPNRPAPQTGPDTASSPSPPPSPASPGTSSPGKSPA